MEPVGAFPGGETVFSMAPHFHVESSFSPKHDESLIFSVNPESNLNSSSQQCTFNDDVFIPNVPAYCFGGLNHIPVNNDAFISMDGYKGIAGVNEESITNPYVTTFSNVGVSNDFALTKEMVLKRTYDVQELQRGDLLMVDSFENTKKRLRRDGGLDGQSPCSYSSEDENAASDSKAYPILKSNGKPRGTKGGATDPQSLYAKKRRERINERLKILQSLVPNGTKVDISTMLEEAVHYVRFLQLQIKLLSSDELWMFAPLAYNGIDVALHHQFFPQLLRH